MRDSNREALSAILDGESSEFEVRRALADMEADDLASFGRWQLARDVMRRQRVSAVPQSFSARLSNSLVAEKQQASPGRGLFLARVAVVATVAFATLFGFQYWSGPGQPVDYFTTLNAPEQRLSDFSGEVSPVSQTLESPAEIAVTESEVLGLQEDDQPTAAGQVLE